MYRERYGKLRGTIRRREAILDIVSKGYCTPNEIQKQMILLFPDYKTCNLYLDLRVLRRESSGMQGSQGYYRIGTSGDTLIWDSTPPVKKVKQKLLPCGRNDTICYYPCRNSHICKVEKKGKKTIQPYVRPGELYYG